MDWTELGRATEEKDGASLEDHLEPIFHGERAHDDDDYEFTSELEMF